MSQMPKSQVKSDMTYTRQQLRLIDEAMRWGDWQKIADISLELSGIWGTIHGGAVGRVTGEGDWF